MWVIMKLGYGSPLKVPKQDDETPDIDPGISYELNYYNGGFDVGGAEPINYQMGGGWQVDMVGGTVSRTFQGVDLLDVNVNLQDGEEAKLERPVLIMSPKASFLLFEN
ncbi:uncharacterized protein LOC112497582 [Citrus sinensis]|uniref:uncharacterized protein LOC112497582 n=1 Tax=Citrus sinensis TaxID=2711 RepID=UPI0022798F34|nr:uncharacterized protein LOC112497582 [Citrus sinensis]